MKKKSTSAKRAASKKTGSNGKSPDAIQMLKDDHDMVKGIFKKYRSLVEKGGSKRVKMALVKEACDALAVHAQIEEELFYPAMQEVVENSTLAEAFVEHDCAKELIEQLEQMRDDEAVFDAKFIVLGEQVKHHIEEEETEIFPKAKKSKIDLKQLAEEMQELKDQLEKERSFPERSIVRDSVPAYVQ